MSSKLMKKDFTIVQNFPKLILISLAIILAGVVFMFVTGLNIGIDYEGGAKIEIELAGDYAEDATFKSDFEKYFTDFINSSGYSVADKMQISPLTEGGSTYEFRLAYELNGSKVSKTDEAQAEFIQSLNGVNNDASKEGFRGTLEDEVKEYFERKDMADEYVEGCVKVAVIGATSSKSLLNATFLAIALALVAILVYIMIRFTVASGLAAICGLAHDVLIMVALTAIFQIPVNTTFIAAVITIIGYSINSSIVIFDKVRECKKSAAFGYASNEEIANYSIKHSLVKVLLSVLTTLIMVVALVLFSVSTIQEFILPIIFGLIAGTFSATCINPSLWVIFEKIGAKAKSKKA